MPKRNANISLSSYDDIFSTEESRAEAKQERVQEIPLSELHPFEGHPFRVVDDEDMMKTVESVREYGVLTPAIVRPDPYGGYEIMVLKEAAPARSSDLSIPHTPLTTSYNEPFSIRPLPSQGYSICT